MTKNNNINMPLPITVANGGTGDTSFTAYSVLCGGTTSTAALQNVSGLGTSGYALVSQGAGALPQWATSGASSIIQIQSTTLTSTFSTSSTTFTALTGVSVTITPTYSNSKILIIYNVNATNNSGTAAGYLQLNRGSTPICVGTLANSNLQSTSGTTNYSGYDISTSSMNYIDSPATTSATTYNIYVTVGGSGGTLYVNETSSSTGTSYGAYASTITALEVGII